MSRRDSYERGTKKFTTYDLMGQQVEILTRAPDIRYSGILHEYFDSSESIVLKRYIMHIKDEKGQWIQAAKGDFMILKRDAWLVILCPNTNMVE
jgi:hypothetical protein